MKSISKFISLALLIAAATACNTKEIDKPDIPDQPQISGNVRFTASMKQTRVEYSVNGDKLHQRWEVDDVIYGFYGDNPVGKVTLKVTEVDEDTEYATLEATVAEEGAAFIAAIKNAGEKHIPVGLLYTGSNDNAVNNKTVTVDMHDQSSGNIPACMTSNKYEITKDSESGDTLIQFVFANECAILEIQSLTGIENKLLESQTIDLASIEVEGVLPYCEYTYDNGSFSSEQSDEYFKSVIVMPTTERPLRADSKGNIIDTDGKRSCIRIAVGASSVSSEITVTATAKDASSTQYSSKYKGVLHPGCYIICAKDVVAKTEDGFYFTTVKAAFDHAEYLNVNSLLGDKPNIVTLVKDCSFGDDDINIDGYDVILDLNGKTLSLSEEGVYFYVRYDKTTRGMSKNESSFTIRDSNGGGIIEGLNEYFIVDSYGVLNIEGGTLDARGDAETIRNRESGIFYMTEGVLKCVNWPTIDNRGEATIEGGTVSISIGEENERIQDCEVITNDGKLTIKDGIITSDIGYYSIISEGELFINGGSISSDGKPLYDQQGRINGYSSTVCNYSEVTITGGLIEATNGYALYTGSDTESSATITGGKISSTNNYAVYAAGGAVNISQGDGESCEISTETESTLLLLNNTSGTISGGTIMSSGKCAVSMNQTSTLTVSGGIIICTGTNPDPTSNLNSYAAIQCRANKEGDNPTLIVTWPEGGYTADTNEPLLYSTSDTPIAEMSAKVQGYPDFYSTVTIQGGCLYTGVNGGAFFRQDEGTYTPLQYNNADFFYTNTSNLPENISYVGITSTSVESKQIESNDHNIPNVGTLKFDSWIKIVNR